MLFCHQILNVSSLHFNFLQRVQATNYEMTALEKVGQETSTHSARYWNNLTFNATSSQYYPCPRYCPLSVN